MPLPVGIALDTSQLPTTQAEKDEMERYLYQRLLGCVMWGQLATRPDLCFPVSLLALSDVRVGSGRVFRAWAGLWRVRL